MKFDLEETLRGAPDEKLLDDIRRSAQTIGRDTITIAEYEVRGKVHPSTIQRRFGSWPKALARAGLKPSRSKMGITNDELFENIKSLSTSLARQPRYNEVKAPSSQFSAGTYENRFGSWSKALREFVAWANSDVSPPSLQEVQSTLDAENSSDQIGVSKRRTRREISDRQRFRILVRDGFRCQSCGASPLVQSGIELHVDHVLPWSKGGETTDDNLVAKCKQCNLGKGNAFNV